MILLVTLVVCVLIGWLAQSWKGRTGALWFVISAIVLFGIMFLLFVSVQMHNPDLLNKESGIIAWTLMTNVIGGAIMLLVVATLPKRKPQ
jgi:hypothetical protein